MKSTARKAAQQPAAPQASSAPAVNVAMGLTEWLLIMVLSIIWGGSFFFIKIAVGEVPPLTLVTFLIPVSAILPGVFILGESVWDGMPWAACC